MNSCIESSSCCSSSDKKFIKEVCFKSDSSCESGSSHCDKKKRRTNCGSFDPGVFTFNTMITPLNNLVSFYTNQTGLVQFTLRRKNKTVILNWEGFSATIGANGIAFISVIQCLCNLPNYIIDFPIFFTYKGVGRVCHASLNPYADTGSVNLTFYLNTDGSSNNINSGDSISMNGGSISWMVE